MAFDAYQRKISEVLSGDFKYLIPRYQRKYVWEEKQWLELLDDLKYCLDNDNFSTPSQEWTHFLGSFVFEKNINSKDFIVIDGQQRLTTITIMLCAVCVMFNELGEKDRFNGITKYILGIDDMGHGYSRIANDELINFQLIVEDSTTYNPMQSKDDLFSGTYLYANPKDNVNIKRCFMFYYTQFSEMIESSPNKPVALSKIKDKILNLDVIEIRATNQQESYNIFEILNARGVDLQQHELIKNYVLKYIQPRTNIDSAKIKWDKIENALFIEKRSVMVLFFNHYVSHRFCKPTKENSEFRIIKTQCAKNDMTSLLDDLLKKAIIYRWFYIPEECSNIKIRSVLQFFKDNNHRQFRPIFLSVISAFTKETIETTLVEEFFQFMQNFYFGYGLVCGGKSNALDDTVYEYARKIENGNSKIEIIEFISKLKKYYPPYPQFLTAFKLIGYSNKVKSYKTPAKKRDVQYILKKIENYWQSSNHELCVNEFTIEHIGNDDGTEPHCRIGNLLPLAEPVNNKIGSISFIEKLVLYNRSNFISVKNFVKRYNSKTNWTTEDIDNRSAHLAQLAYDKIWKLPNIEPTF